MQSRTFRKSGIAPWDRNTSPAAFRIDVKSPTQCSAEAPRTCATFGAPAPMNVRSPQKTEDGHGNRVKGQEQDEMERRQLRKLDQDGTRHLGGLSQGLEPKWLKTYLSGCLCAWFFTDVSCKHKMDERGFEDWVGCDPAEPHVPTRSSHASSSTAARLTCRLWNLPTQVSQGCIQTRRSGGSGQ